MTENVDVPPSATEDANDEVVADSTKHEHDTLVSTKNKLIFYLFRSVIAPSRRYKEKLNTNVFLLHRNTIYLVRL